MVASTVKENHNKKIDTNVAHGKIKKTNQYHKISFSDSSQDVKDYKTYGKKVRKIKN
jgi:hypothetical protein